MRRVCPAGCGMRTRSGVQLTAMERDVARLVAAGSLGSTELLLRCRDVTKTLPNLSPRLDLPTVMWKFVHPPGNDYREKPYHLVAEIALVDVARHLKTLG